MNYMVLVLCLVLSFLAQAGTKPKIAFLTSIDPKDGKLFFQGKSYNNNQKFEKEFRKHFNDADVDISVTHFASIEDIWSALHDKSTSAVFFLSHSSSGQSKSAGALVSPSLIADFDGNDLKNAFQKVHNNLKYLAVIGCESEAIIDQFRKYETYSNAPDLVIKTFNDKIRPIKGLRDAIKDSREHIVVLADEEDQDELSDNLLSRQIPFNANPESIRPTLILMNKKVVGFFPKGRPGEVQTIGIDLPLNGKSSLINDSGLSSAHKKEEVTLGELKFLSPQNNCELNAERNRQGEILGIGKHYYRLNCQ